MNRRDLYLLFATRITRLFAYGFLSVVLALYLAEVGLNHAEIGLLFALTLLGDAGISLWITTRADRLGRRRMLMFGAALMILAGVVFLFTSNFVLLLVAAIIGVISPSGNDIGPFLSIEQASLTTTVSDQQRTRVFAWYNTVGSFATAVGALVGGGAVQLLHGAGVEIGSAYQVIIAAYSLSGFLLLSCFFGLSPRVEVPAVAVPQGNPFLGLHRSKKVVLKLSLLFSLDAFAGGFILQSMVALWFSIRFGVEPSVLGGIFFGANVLAGVSALLAVPLSKRIGLINTMVFTHIPSNILLMLVPLMPNVASAIFLLLLRFSISQMDVPTRQSYTMAVVDPAERSAASGVTSIARSIGASLSPLLSGVFLAVPALLSAPFFMSGGLKIIYDLLLYREFRAHPAPEEKRNEATP